MSSFEDALLKVLKFEGIYSADPCDPGGETFGTVASTLNMQMSKLKCLVPLVLTNGEHVDKDIYDPMYSLPYYKQPQLRDDVYNLRIPSPTAPRGTYENDIYNSWINENPKKKYPLKYSSGAKLIVGNIVSSKYMCRLKYFKDTVDVGDGHLLSIKGHSNNISLLALILQSTFFRGTLYKHCPKLYKVDYRLDINKLKSLPIPIETEANKAQFKRLYEIGQKLIIEGVEDSELRKEADSIIEKLYEGFMS